MFLKVAMEVGTVNSEIAPAVETRPILSTKDSVNHRAPSGPDVISCRSNKAKTNMVTAVRILDKDAADCPQFVPLVKETAQTFTIVAFEGLFPRVMISSIDPQFNLTIYNASASQYSLKAMLIVALVFVPIVLVYQGWTYWVFRKRITRALITDHVGGHD